MSFIAEIIMRLDSIVDDIKKTLGDYALLNIVFYTDNILYSVIFKDNEIYYYMSDDTGKKLMFMVGPINFKPELKEGYLDDLELFYLPLLEKR